MTSLGVAQRVALAALMASCGGTTSDHEPAAGDSPIDGGPVADAAVAYDAATTELRGTLGTTGTIRPIVSTRAISNSGETLVYMTTAPLSCEQLTVSRWLGAFDPGAQVIEIVVSGAAKLGPGNRSEVNWATGGRSSAYEQNAKTASVVFTKAEAMGVLEGTVSATYDNPVGDVAGHFHAEFCPNGQDY